MRKEILVFLVIVLTLTNALVATEIDQKCFKMLCPNNFHKEWNENWGKWEGKGSINPDSIMIDTCSNSQNNGSLYSKGYFQLQFKKGFYPFDKTLNKDEIKNISEISNSKSRLKQQFESLESNFGKVKIKGLLDKKIEKEKDIQSNPIFLISFEKYQNINDIEEYVIKNIDSIKYFKYNNRMVSLLNLPNDVALSQNIEGSDISGTLTFYRKNWKHSGFQSEIFEIKCPLAWEISKGTPSVRIDISDYFEDPTLHPDVYPNHETPTIGDGTYPCLPLGDWHGLWVTSNATALDNNIDGKMVGAGPRCHSISTFAGNNASLYDLDGIRNSMMVYPDVRNCSYGSNWSEPRLDQNDINEGIVVVAATGNDRKCLNGSFDYAYEIKPDGKYYFTPTIIFPASSVYYDPVFTTDGTRDYRVIAVGATKSGILKDLNCTLWGPGFAGTPNWSNQLQFNDVFNFSTGLNKFSLISDPIARRAEKEKAFIDVVAPGAGVLCADGASSYEIEFGTSMSAPLVSGICGLMLSINRFIGVPLNLPADNLYAKPTYGADVQKKVYDIITFTAKKIPDFENFTRNSFLENGFERYYSYQFSDGSPYQYEYVTQWNDKLKRSWAQRMGFGLVNAYRAVAHSIRQNGPYNYLLSNDLLLSMADNDGALPPDSRGYKNPDNKRIMHWGSMIKEGSMEFELPNWRGPTSGQDFNAYNVLDWGGVSLPGEYHNNQGVTRINSGYPVGRKHITVQNPSILAIDGILISDQPTACHYVKTMAGELSESVILMEGLIKDVEITGNLKVGDLIIESSIDNGISGVPGCVGFQSALTGNYGEIYGEVFVNNKALLYAWSNFKVQPGGYIHLNGEKDMYLHGFSIMTMRNNSGVDGLEGRKIVVEGQAELFIEDSAIVDIDCEIYVLSGGKLTLGTKAVAKIKKLNIEAGATVTVPSGAVMALKDPEHIVNGNFYVGSEPSLYGTAKVIGKLDEHCLPLGTEKYANTEYISTQPVIYMKGSATTVPPSSNLTICNAEFKNISINATDVNIPQQIYNSGFYTESRHSNPFFNFDYLISINYDRCQNYNPQINRLVMFDNCQFIDSSAIEKFPSDQNNWNKFIYRTGGVLLNDCEYVRFNVCDFKRLEYGIMANNSIQMDIHNSKFDTCGIGDYAFSTGTLLCQNEYNVVRYGSFRDNAYGGAAYNNIYTKTRLAYYAVNSGEQRLRGNEFNQYYRAISSINTKILMQNIIENNRLKIYGMNEFYMEDQITPLTLPTYSNKFITKICEIDSIADVYTAGKVFDLHVECGRNKFSKYATYHFLNKVPGNPILVVKINAMFPDLFPLPCLPRVFGLIPDYDANPALIYITQWSDDVDNMRYPGLCCGDKTDIFVNDICITVNVSTDYHCGEQMPLGLYSTDLLSLPLDGNLITNTTQNKLIALSSYLSNSENSKQLLSNLKTELFKTHLVSDEDKSLIRLCIDLKLLDSININDYQTDYVNNLIFKHSIYRKNNKNDLQSMGYMSMLSFLSNRYDKGCNDGISDVNESTESDLNIVSIVPNPATDIATLTFTAPNTNAVDIIISDIQGNTVFKETTFPTSNNNTYKINSKNMTPGVYLVTLSSNGHRVTEKLIVVK